MFNRMMNVLAFAVLSLLWLAFIIALLVNREWLVTAWEILRSWPIVVQVAVWLLTLPVTLGLWIWQTSWPVVLRLVLVAGLAWATIYTFLPGRALKRMQDSPTQS